MPQSFRQKPYPPIRPSGAPGNGLYGYHAYMVTDYNSSSDTFTLQNPWGFAHPGPLTWSQLQSG
jgi:hypothetical protein